MWKVYSVQYRVNIVHLALLNSINKDWFTKMNYFNIYICYHKKFFLLKMSCLCTELSSEEQSETGWECGLVGSQTEVAIYHNY